MLRLYQFVTSPFCAKVRKILDYKGIDYELVEVDYLDRRALLEASGQIMVPALTLESGDTITDSDRIAHRLEEVYPEPAIFPAEWRGIHLALARYFDSELEDALFRTAMPDELAYFRRQGADREALWRLMRERRYGAGFCEQMVRENRENLERVEAILAPLDESLDGRAFLLGRIGYGDFALYGQLTYLAFTGEQKLPARLANLRAFYERMDRISAIVEETA
ncbi:MAG TPA: glutathione S-transferase family protein [Candidatus Binataceae bacterium]|nr:glutathione S-transferase family protein [Candidatus Binataceae bacterium]